MPGCPSCGRPLALARPRCLYCGAPLLPELLASARGATPTDERDPAGAAASTPQTALARVLLVLDLAGVSETALARATGLSAYDARLLARRGGLHLLRVLEPEAAADARARLVAEGVVAFEIPEAEARVPPLRLVAGERHGARLALRAERERLELDAEELLLVVKGEIAREPPARFEGRRRRVDSARPLPGLLLHLHRAADPRPLEIDADNFSPGFAATGSARLELAAWLEAIAPAVACDDGFRRLPVALSPAESEERGPLGAVAALRRGARKPVRSGKDAPALLDNAAQFRFYSGWRAAVERRRRHSPAAPSAC